MFKMRINTFKPNFNLQANTPNKPVTQSRNGYEVQVALDNIHLDKPSTRTTFLYNVVEFFRDRTLIPLSDFHKMFEVRYRTIEGKPETLQNPHEISSITIMPKIQKKCAQPTLAQKEAIDRFVEAYPKSTTIINV
jgi:hypothetical protein